MGIVSVLYTTLIEMDIQWPIPVLSRKKCIGSKIFGKIHERNIALSHWFQKVTFSCKSHLETVPLRRLYTHHIHIAL